MEMFMNISGVPLQGGVTTDDKNILYISKK